MSDQNHPLLEKWLVWDYDGGSWDFGTVKAVFEDGTMLIQWPEPDAAHSCLVSPHNPHIERLNVFNSEREFRAWVDVDPDARRPKIVPLHKGN